MQPHAQSPHRFRLSPRKAGAFAALAVAVAALPGCQIGQLIGGMADSAHRAGSKEVKAKYKGLEGKNFAVIVAADRAIQADFPDVVAVITAEVTRRVAEKAGAVGVVPAEDVLRFQGRRPGWIAMSPVDVAAALGVERLIYIDLSDYTLTDPGNRYVWKGVAAGLVGVVEAEKTAGDDFRFRQSVQVRFPDKENTGEMEMPESTVQQALQLRFVNRCSWIFFDHEESNVIEY